METTLTVLESWRVGSHDCAVFSVWIGDENKIPRPGNAAFWQAPKTRTLPIGGYSCLPRQYPRVSGVCIPVPSV